MSPGVFTDAVIGNIIVNEQDLFASSRMTELNMEIIAGAAILNNMDSKIVEIGSGTSCMAAKVYTMRSNSLDKGSKTMTCDLTSTVKHGTDGLQLSKQALVNFENFQIEDTLCNSDIDFAEQFAYLDMKAKVSLEQKLSKALVAMAATNADVPVKSEMDLSIGTVTGNILQIPEPDFTADLLGNLKLAGRKTGMISPLILNGDNFYTKAILNEFESNGCCSNDAILNSKKHFEIFWDVLNVDPVTTAKSTFLIDKNSMVFWSSPVFDKKVSFEDAMKKPNASNDTYKYVDILPRLKYFANGKLNDIYVDVRAKRGCVLDSLGVSRDAWVFEYYLYGDLKMNLVNHLNKKGIIRIDRVAA
jgi:hypothetical protein